MTKFTFIDVESVWDEYLHEAYREIDPTGAGVMQRDGKHRHRLPCKRVIAAAAFDLLVEASGAISVGGLRSWIECDYGSDREIAIELFKHIRDRPQHHVVTWGGLAAEVPLLNFAAMEHQLVLPPQLQISARRFNPRSEWLPHVDLGLQVKGKGRTWTHLTEMGLRLGLPGELFAGKPDIAEPRTREEWEAMRHRVGTDCIITAMIALVYWRANGLISLDQVATLHNIADWCVRNRVVAEHHVEPLRRFRMQMLERMGADWDEAA